MVRLIIRRLVVLPHPDGPTNTVICPVGSSRDRLSTATLPPGKVLVTSSNVIIELSELLVRHRVSRLPRGKSTGQVGIQGVSRAR